MIQKMQALLKANDMCVLATCSGQKPHCSLMAYVTDDEGGTLYMISRKQTHKYRSFLENPYVSLLVDTRCEQQENERGKIQALTVNGVFTPLENSTQREAMFQRIVERHPHLKELAHHPDAEVFSIRIESFQLLDGALDARFEKVQ